MYIYSKTLLAYRLIGPEIIRQVGFTTNRVCNLARPLSFLVMQGGSSRDIHAEQAYLIYQIYQVEGRCNHGG